MENIEKMVQEALDSTKSAHKRIDRMEKRQDNLEALSNAFSGKRWDGLIDKAIAVVVGAAIGFLLNGGGF